MAGDGRRDRDDGGPTLLVLLLSVVALMAWMVVAGLVQSMQAVIP